MTIQFVVVLAIVGVCAAWMFRSWLRFFQQLSSANRSNQPLQSRCHGCSAGCKVPSQTNAPTIVQLGKLTK